MSDQIKNITDASFEEDVLKSELPVLVDFWAPWCGPCKMLAEPLAEVAAQFEGRMKVVKMNVDENQIMSNKLGVRGIPALFLYQNGELIAQKTGACTKSSLVAFAEKAA